MQCCGMWSRSRGAEIKLPPEAGAELRLRLLSIHQTLKNLKKKSWSLGLVKSKKPERLRYEKKFLNKRKGSRTLLFYHSKPKSEFVNFLGTQESIPGLLECLQSRLSYQ